MKIIKKSAKGSILVMVILILAVIMILGVGLIATNMTSHNNAVMQKEKQQAYYAAKSVVDAFLDDLINKKGFSQQKAYIGPSGTLLNQTSDMITFVDERGGEWECKVSVKPAGTNVEVTGTAINTQSGVKGKAIAVVKEDMSYTKSSLVSHNSINAHAKQELDLVDLMTKGGAVDVTVDGNLKATTVQTHGNVKLTTYNDPSNANPSGYLTTGNIITGVNAGALNPMIDAGADITINGYRAVSTNNIFGQSIKIDTQTTGEGITIDGDIIATYDIKITSKGPVNITGTIYAPHGITIDLPAGMTPTIQPGKVHALGNLISIKHSGTADTPIPVSGTVTQSNAAKANVTTKAYPQITEPAPAGGQSLKTYTAVSDVTITECPSCTDNCLQAIYYETTNASSKKIVHLKPAPPGSKFPAYKFYVDNNHFLYFGVERDPLTNIWELSGSTGVPISDTDSRIVGINKLDPATGQCANYNIFTDVAGSIRPYGVYFFKNTNVCYTGNFYPEGAGINVDLESKGLSFGSVSYAFEKYKE